MAFTVTKIVTVFGNKKVYIADVTADAATQTIETGLSYCDVALISPVSMASANFKRAFNSNASGVQSNGVIAITGVASGDRFTVIAIGN